MSASALPSWQTRWYWRPGLLALLASGSIMVLELAVGRIAATYVGWSLYTWTAIISIVMLGISLGSWIGGRLADRWASPLLLGAMLVLGGLLSWSVLLVDTIDAVAQVEKLTQQNLSYVAGLAALGVTLAFLPCLVLGCISPIVVRLTMRTLEETGRTVGRIHALESVGSIAGTFLTGFLLISLFGTRPVVWGVGMLLMLLGALFLAGGRWWALLASVCLLGGATWYANSRNWYQGPCLLETDYYCIKVGDEIKMGDDNSAGYPVKVLILDRLVHSYSSLEDPTRLVYTYERMYAGATAFQNDRHGPLQTLFIGGGGYTFPRFMEAVYPDSELDVIEIDPGVTAIAHELLGLAKETTIRTFNEDARMFLERTPERAYDLVFGDAFNDFSVPYHLTTREFNDRVHAWMAPDGLYVINMIDGPSGELFRSYVHTLRQTWQHVYVVMNVDAWRRATRYTIVIIATDEPLDSASLAPYSEELAGQILDDDTVDALLVEGRTMTLTDRYAPVDQMLLPVFFDFLPEK
jgi:spermidine synthase